jgi:ribonuclease P protein subunit RPR2
MQENRKALVKKIAEERIGILFEMAEGSLKGNAALSKRYVTSLRKISSHYKVKVPKKIRNAICTRCNVVLSPGFNSTVRVVSSHRYIAYKCNGCGKEIHIRY